MKSTTLALAAAIVYVQISSVATRSLDARNDIMCAVIGDQRSSAYKSISGDTYPACSDSCFADPKCQSFAIGAGKCRLYGASVDSNFDWNSDSSFRFYDTGCEKVNKQCGVIGYDVRENYDYSSGTTNSDCVKRCLSQKDCRSYAFGNGECLLYEFPVSGNFNAHSNSPYQFYDRSCITSSSPVTTTRKTTTTTTTKPATTTTKTTTTTATKVATTTVTIANQAFACTAMKK